MFALWLREKRTLSALESREQGYKEGVTRFRQLKTTLM